MHRRGFCKYHGLAQGWGLGKHPCIGKFSHEGSSWLLGTTQEPPQYHARVNGFICIMGIVFMITVFVASLFFGLSWHSCPNGQEDCVNYSDAGISTEVLAVMLIIPTVIITIVSCGECMRLRR